VCVSGLFMENREIDKPQTWGIKPTLINLPMDLHKDAKDNGIVFREALEFGISFLLADKNGCDYPDNKLQEKLYKVIAHRNALLQEIALLRDPVEDVEDVKVVKVSKKEIDKEVDEVFGGLAQIKYETNRPK